MGKVTTAGERPWELTARPGESEDELYDRQDRAYFAWQIEDSVDWWNRMGQPIDLEGLSVLDFGCGHGALSVSTAQRGASSVLGIDLDERRIEFATRYVPEQHPEVSDAVSFEVQDLTEMSGSESFDVILSKDTFEHVENLSDVIAHMHRLLKPGGRILAGFSPLFHSPFGDHGRLEPSLPWLPAMLPERLVLAMTSRKTGTPLRSMADVGLNKLTPAEFRDLFEGNPDWKVDSLQYNQSDRRLMPVMNVLRQMPLLERWFTVGIYAVIRKL